VGNSYKAADNFNAKQAFQTKHPQTDSQAFPLK